MVTVIGIAVLFVVVASASSIGYSRFMRYRKRRQAQRGLALPQSPDTDLQPLAGRPPDEESSSSDDNSSKASSSTTQTVLPTPPDEPSPEKPSVAPVPDSESSESQTSDPPAAANNKPRTHRRSHHLISYTDGSDEEDDITNAANGFSWKRFFLPARHIAFRRRDSESAPGQPGFKMGSLSISPSRPIVFGGGETKNGADRASMCVILTPPSPEVRARMAPPGGDAAGFEEVPLAVVPENQPLVAAVA